MDGLIILLIIAGAVYIFSSSGEKNFESKKTEVKNFPEEFKPAPKKFVRVIFKKGDRKRYDYFLGDNFDIEVGDFVEVWATSKFTGRDELKIVKVVYISEADEFSDKATKTGVRKSNVRGW